MVMLRILMIDVREILIGIRTLSRKRMGRTKINHNKDPRNKNMEKNNESNMKTSK